MNTIETNKGQGGGLLEGESHDNGGIKAVVTDTNQPVELEGGEIIINKESSKEHCETLSEINQSGGGVEIPCDTLKGETKDNMQTGGRIMDEDCGCDSGGYFHNEYLKAIFGV